MAKTKRKPEPADAPTPTPGTSEPTPSMEEPIHDPENVEQGSDKVNEAFEKVIEKQLGKILLGLKTEGVVITKSELRKRLARLWESPDAQPPAADEPPSERAQATSLLAGLQALQAQTREESAAEASSESAPSAQPEEHAPPPAQALNEPPAEYKTAQPKPEPAPAPSNITTATFEKALEGFIRRNFTADRPTPDTADAPQPTSQAPPREEPSSAPPPSEPAADPDTEEQDEPTSIPPIDPARFLIYSMGYTWDNNDPLLSFAEGDEPWKLKDAFEGVLIFGAPGSGKTSGSGSAFAEAFLRTGFGGLVLCAKPGEAQRWQNLCVRCGRGGDVITIDRNGPLLNILAYESQRPGGDIGLATNLVGLFRVLIGIVSRKSTQGKDDEFWRNTTDQLMRSVFEAFILAGETLTVDNLSRFIALAPRVPFKEASNGWRKIPFFGSILARGAQQTDPEAKRVYRRIFDYWTKEFPSYADATRSSITLGFTSMADILGSRGIHKLIGEHTTLTPEAILSGRIVVVDLPIKDFGTGGLLVQAAWKHLLQMAVERRARADNDAHRYPMYHPQANQPPIPLNPAPGTGDRRTPVFLWEDEGQFFFSAHDINFQATCRESRAAHVVISQNLHNFFQLGHNSHAVEGTFSLMNTQVFHCNGDMMTNQWASQKIGQEMKLRLGFSTAPEPPEKGFWDFFKPAASRTTTSSSKQWEPIVRPEEFFRLKNGGDGTCEAILLWVSHQFQSNGGKPFMKLVFEQV